MDKERENILRNFFKEMKTWSVDEVVDWVEDEFNGHASVVAKIKELATIKSVTAIELAEFFEGQLFPASSQKPQETFKVENVKIEKSVVSYDISSSDEDESTHTQDKSKEKKIDLRCWLNGKVEDTEREENILNARRMRFGPTSPIRRPVTHCNGNGSGWSKSPLLCRKQSSSNFRQNVRSNSHETTLSNSGKRSTSNSDRRSRSSRDKISRSNTHQTSRSSRNKRSRSSRDKRSRSNTDRRFRSSMDKRSPSKPDKRSSSKTDRKSPSKTDNRSHSTADKRSLSKADKRLVSSTTKSSRSNSDKRSRSCSGKWSDPNYPQMSCSYCGQRFLPNSHRNSVPRQKCCPYNRGMVCISSQESSENTGSLSYSSEISGSNSNPEDQKYFHIPTIIGATRY